MRIQSTLFLKQKGFTLIEMVIAIALGAVILVAASSLLLSITQLWIKEEHLDDFQGHVHGVKTFLQTHFNEASYRINQDLPTVEWSSPPLGSQLGTNESYLSFYVYTPSPLFRTESLVPIVCYLSFDKQNGLSIIWHSLEKSGGIYETPLSPWVKGIKLHYYDLDSNHWNIVDKPRKGKNRDNKLEFQLPDLLELQFAKEGEANQSSFIRLHRNHKPGEAIL